MANALANLFTDIADSIRSKTGSTEKLSPSEFASQIDSISVGGGDAEGCVTVTFMNGDNVLLTRPVYIGDDCPDPVTQGRIETPTKESTVQYNYTHSGWTSYNGGTANSSVLKNITEDKVVYSAYSATVVKYTITYYDEDGTTLLHTEQVGYGSVPNYTPTKEDATFDKWVPTIVAVTGDASYTASWKTGIVASGSCGDNATWELNVMGELTISGTGVTKAMSSMLNKPTYFDYAAEVTSVTIEDGITGIGSNAFFSDFKSLLSVNIADSVTSIGQGAFGSCTALTSITLSENLTKINNMTFNGCTALTSVNIPDSVTSIGYQAFYGCTALTSVNIPENVTSIGEQAFYNCYNLTSATFEDTEGWTAGSTALSSSDLAVTSTAASYLRSTYKSRTWTKS